MGTASAAAKTAAKRDRILLPESRTPNPEALIPTRDQGFGIRGSGFGKQYAVSFCGGFSGGARGTHRLRSRRRSARSGLRQPPRRSPPALLLVVAQRQYR